MLVQGHLKMLVNFLNKDKFFSGSGGDNSLSGRIIMKIFWTSMIQMKLNNIGSVTTP